MVRRRRGPITAIAPTPIAPAIAQPNGDASAALAVDEVPSNDSEFPGDDDVVEIVFCAPPFQDERARDRNVMFVDLEYLQDLFFGAPGD